MLTLNAGLGAPPCNAGDLVVNVSRIQAYNRCNRYWFHKYFQRRELDAPKPAALELGTIVHDLIEQLHRGQTPQAPQLPEHLAEWQPWVTHVLQAYAQRLEVWGAWDEVLSIEQDMWLECALPGAALFFVGRGDMIARKNGKTRHVQVKTLSRTVDPSHFATQQAFSLHEAVYGAMIDRIWPDTPYMGTELMMLVKQPPPKEPVNTTKDGRITDHYQAKLVKYDLDKQQYMDRIVDRRVIAMERRHMEELVYEAIDSVLGMDAIRRKVRPATRAGGSACHRYGRACQYLDVCANRASLDGPAFRNRENDYVDDLRGL